MKNTNLLMEITINDENISITAICPDEDDEICIAIKNRYKVNYSLTIDEAEAFAKFIITHVNNVRNINL